MTVPCFLWIHGPLAVISPSPVFKLSTFSTNVTFFLSLVYLNGKNTVCTPTTSLKLDPTAPSGFKFFKVSELHSE